MNPCAKHQQALALLALNALEPGQAGQLRAHIAECRECRDYLQHLSALAQKLDAIQLPENVKTSAAFHNKVAAAVRAEASGSSLFAQIFNWRIAAPALASIAIVTLAISLSGSRDVPATAPVVTQSAAIPTTDLPPSLAIYRLAMNQSSDQLDKLLTLQANHALLTRPPGTASIVGVTDLRNQMESEE